MAIQSYSDVSLLLPMTGVDDATVFDDYSHTPKVVSAHGNARTKTDQSKFYSSSGYFDGSGDYLSIPVSGAFVFGTGDFCVEVYVRPVTVATTYQGIFETRNDHYQAAPLFTLIYGVPTLWVNGAARLQSGSALTVDIWQHVALCRSNGTTKMFVDGTQVGSDYMDSNDYNAYNVYVGAQFDGVYNFCGHMQDFCITKGFAPYTTTFTPPGKLLRSISGTVYDAAGDPAQRNIFAFSRNYPNYRGFSTQSSDVDGSYFLGVPDIDTEFSRVVLADETTLYNDIIDRVLPG